MPKQNGFLCGTCKKHDEWILHYNGQDGFGLYKQHFYWGELWTPMWYQGPIWVGSLDASIRRSEQLDEVGLSLGFFCCWLCGSNQALWSRFVPTFCGHWHWFQIWCV